MYRNVSSGYAGLIALLITCLIIGLIAWRADLFSGKSSATGVTPTEQDLSAIKAAEQAKQQIENRNSEQMKQFEN